MIFLTVGTYPLPFDRLIQWIDDLLSQGKVPDSVFAQIGYSTYVPLFMKSVKMMAETDFDEVVKESSAVISHAGLGSITAALEHLKPILVVPRMVNLGEVVSDHQLHTARRFAELGHVLTATTEHEIEDRLRDLMSFRPRPRNATPELVADAIGSYLRTLMD
jgi:exopolysaccharide biosynthesis glucuronosyltransferase PssE